VHLADNLRALLNGLHVSYYTGVAALVDGSGAFCPRAWRASHTILPFIVTVVCSEHCSKHSLTLCFLFLQSPAPRSTFPPELLCILSLATSM
jgi:hypothetical protein